MPAYTGMIQHTTGHRGTATGTISWQNFRFIIEPYPQANLAPQRSSICQRGALPVVSTTTYPGKLQSKRTGTYRKSRHSHIQRQLL
ncbi:hypothetical protein DF182_17875 [Chitinophaga flava]|uniref:Uncharacterized protein n=1 Tax=Chitinophaga flava TaxID=2259036 RepID=A0A365XQ29_9BACT|nr:hypothetical protein DF182_17875 [Chitinophaga flava]